MSTGIEWTDETWNPVTGCTKVSPGCDHCYAETLHERFHGKGSFDTVTLHPDRLDKPLHWRKPRRVFVNSMSDLFHADVPDEYIGRVWQTMGAAPQHTYQILTKRHARMRSWVNRWYSGEIPEPYDVRPVPGFPGYTVSTTGEVFGVRGDTRNGLAHDVGEQGHRRVTLHRAGSPRSGERQLVHRLVLTTFARWPRHGEQACHRNGDPSDNRLSNLYWGSQEDNWRDRIRHGNGRSYAKLNEHDVEQIRHRADAGESAYSIAKDYPVSDTQVRNILTGTHWAPADVAPRVHPPTRVVLDCVWLGVSVETQQWADIRVPALLDTPAAIRFLSCEPLLGPIDLFGPWGEPVECDELGPAVIHQGFSYPTDYGTGVEYDCEHHAGVDWVIVGGESGPHARPMHADWARALRDQCRRAGVPYFFKQWGEHAPRCTLALCGTRCTCNGLGGGHPIQMRRVGKKAAGRELDGRTWDQYPQAVTA